jgi:hypothetical protein
MRLVPLKLRLRHGFVSCRPSVMFPVVSDALERVTGIEPA